MDCKNTAKGRSGITARAGNFGSVYISSKAEKGTKRAKMDFIQDHWQYIFSNATSKAVDVAFKTGLINDVEDFRQEIIIFLSARAHRFDPSRAGAHRFIEICTESARKNLIRNIYRKRKRFVSDTIALDTVKDSAIDDKSNVVSDMLEYIDTLPELQQKICRDFFFNGIPIRTIGKSIQQPKEKVVEMIREFMQPFAMSIGICNKTARHVATESGDHPEGQKVLPDLDFRDNSGGSSQKI